MGRKAGARAGIEVLEPRVLLSGVLVADINTQPSRAYYPFGFARVGGVTYFSQHDGVHGLELWKTDGTDAGTVMIKDIFPGLGSGEPAYYVATADGTVYFTATNGPTGYELYKTDGTDGGTVLVKDINPGYANSIPTYLAAVGNKVYFFAEDGVHGNELWVSDGTAAGTQLIKDILPGATGQTSKILSAANGRLFFQATDASSTNLWTSTGAVGNATILKSNFASFQMTPFDNRVYFTDQGGNVYTSDGTVNGTVPVQSINTKVAQFVVCGGALYFNRQSGTGRGVYRILAGGQVVTSMGTGFTNPNSLANVNGDLYFTDTTSTGASLYQVRSGDSSAGLVANVAPGVSSASLANLVGVGGSLYFTLNTPANGYSLWTLANSGAQPQLVSTLNTGPKLFAPFSFTSAGSRLVFVSDDSSSGMELWTSDGTPGGTMMIHDWFPGTAWSNPFFIRQLGDQLLFRADGVNGAEPLAVDAAGNLTALGDLEPGTGSSAAYGTTVVGNQLIMGVTTTALGRELWATDGTPGGTQLLKDIATGSASSDPSSFIEFGGKVFFAATDAAHGTEMWMTDGTSAGTVLLKDIISGTGSGGFSAPVVMNGVLFFAAADAATGGELWRSDGTVAGTYRVADIYTGAQGSSPANLTVSNGVLYFSATDPTSGTELWRSDGSEVGTRLVKNIYAGGLNASPTGLTSSGEYLYFQATDASGKTAWRTDGTDAGTIRLGTAALSPYGFTNMNGAAYFFATGVAKTWDLWRSDGTLAGTSLFAPLAPAPATNFTPFTPRTLTLVNGRLFFLADDGATSLELWSSDGTRAGTSEVEDLNPGTIQGVIGSQLATLNGAIYVEADNGLYGFEPWRFADAYAPVVWKQAIDLRAAPAFEITFNEAINPLASTDLVLTNLTRGEVIPSDQIGVAYDASTHVIRLTFPGYLHGSPPDGNYRLSFGVGVVADVAGNSTSSSMTFDFFILAGDVNHDRTVDFLDLAKLAQNYNTTGGKTFADGDFNYDGNVDFLDLAILAQRYNTTLAAPASVAAAPATAPVKKTKTVVPSLPPAAPQKPVVAKKPVRSAFAVTRLR